MIGSASARPNIVYRLIRALMAVVGRRLFRVRVSGVENLPRPADGPVAGGWICCVLPHRNWVEPFLVASLLPADPRLVFIADGPTIARSRLRRLLARMVGGILPVWPRASQSAFAGHLTAAASTISAGAVLAIFPEVGPPSRPPALRRLSPGVAHFSRHTQAAVVPVVFGGTHELYLRRRIEVRILPPLEPPAVASDRQAIDVFMAQLQAAAEAAADDAHAVAEAEVPRGKRWLWLTGRYPRAE